MNLLEPIGVSNSLMENDQNVLFQSSWNIFSQPSFISVLFCLIVIYWVIFK